MRAGCSRSLLLITATGYADGEPEEAVLDLRRRHGADEVLPFPFDAATGHVGAKVRAYRAAPGSGPRHVLARPGLMYLLNELGNTLVALQPEPGGTLTEVQAVSTLPPGFAGDSHTAHLGLSADERYLYVSNRGHDSLTAFAVGPDGLVTPCQWIPSGAGGPGSSR